MRPSTHLHLRPRRDAICADLVTRYDALIGILLDGSYAMGELARQMMDAHTEHIEELQRSHSSIDPASINPIFTYNGIAEDSSGPLHHTTVLDFIRRNGVDGANWELLAQVCLVMAYQYWEDDTRLRLAEALNVPKNQIAMPIMGELRHYRRAILHNRGRALPEMERNTLLPVFRRGERVAVDSQMYLDIMFALKRHVSEFGTPVGAEGDA